MLGGGKQGEVFKVKRLTDNKIFAAKTFYKKVEGWWVEQEFLTRLDHRNIIRLEEAIDDGGEIKTLILEFFEGQRMWERTKKIAKHH